MATKTTVVSGRRFTASERFDGSMVMEAQVSVGGTYYEWRMTPAEMKAVAKMLLDALPRPLDGRPSKRSRRVS